MSLDTVINLFLLLLIIAGIGYIVYIKFIKDSLIIIDPLRGVTGVSNTAQLKIEQGVGGVSKKGGYPMLTFPMKLVNDNSIGGTQYFSEVKIFDPKNKNISNTFNVIVDSGSADFICTNMTIGTILPGDTQYNMYGAVTIPQKDCIPSNKLYWGCAVIQWYDTLLGEVPFRAGNITSGGAPNLFGVGDTYDLNGPNALNWNLINNITLDFKNGIFTVNDTDNNNLYVMIPRISLPPSYSNYFTIKAQTISLNGKNFNVSDYGIVIDSGTPVSGIPETIYKAMGDSDMLNIGINEHLQFGIQKYMNMGNVPFIIIGNVYFTGMKILFNNTYVGFTQPSPIQVNVKMDENKLAANVFALQKMIQGDPQKYNGKYQNNSKLKLIK